MMGIMGFIENTNRATQLEYSGDNLLYLGKAVAGSLTSEAVWSIQKFTYDIDNRLVLTEWAGGESNEDNVWDDRASLIYS